MSDPNTELLVEIADALGGLRERFVFVGGCATALLLTDPGAAPVRVTRDVDVIAAVSSLSEYHAIGEALKARGFTQGLTRSEPPYRWSHGRTWLDVLPVDPAILGFANRWYASALRSAQSLDIGSGLAVRVIDAPCFVACKLEAFRDRGEEDFAESHDFEDVLTVVDGRAELVEEISAAPVDIRQFIGEAIAPLLRDRSFVSMLPGLIADGTPERATIVLDRLNAIAQIVPRAVR